MSKILEMRGMLVKREERPVLQVDEFSIERGETVAVVGPNGAGKSTLLLVIARLLVPEEGDILQGGIPISKIRPVEYRRNLALVMQEPLLLNRSVAENVALGLRYRGVPAQERTQRVDEWLKRLGIAHLADRPAGKLSGGEARRASLARAFVLSPQLLLLDEPFGGLDTPTRQRLFGDLGGILAETNTTTIFITHQLDEAIQLGTRLVVLLGGRIQQSGAPQEVVRQPANREVGNFLNMPELED